MTSTPTDPVMIALQWGILGLAVLVFGLVIKHLYNANQALHMLRTKEHAEAAALLEKERTVAAQERAAMVAKAAGEAAAQRAAYDAALAANRRESLEREDRVRTEMLEAVEEISERSAEAGKALTEVLLKISDRYQPQQREQHGNPPRGRY